MPPRRRIGRKLLVASLGVASVSYVACGRSDTSTTSGDSGLDGQVADASKDAPFDQIVANLVGPPVDAPFDQIVANLVPPPSDAGLDSQD